MTSETVPPTIPSVSTGTPAGEWSESVLASSAKSDAPVKVSTIPGALGLNIMEEPDPEPESKEPEKAEKQPEEGEGRQGSREATTSVPATAAQTATQPEVTSQEEHHDHASMPSEELKGAQPHEHTGGVGALPGNISESSVALLPDERGEGKIPSTPPQSAGPGRERRDTIKPTPATFLAAGSEQTQPRESEKAEQAKISGEGEPPKQERVPSIPADISTGASAEPIEAENKARLVETSESENGKKTSDAGQAVPTGEAPADAGVSSVGTKSDVGETGEREQGKEPSAASAKADQGKDPTRDEGEENNKQVRPPTKPGYGGDYHPAELHPPPPGASVAEYHASGAVQKEEEPEAPPSPTQAKRASGGTGKKPGFVSMFKGEMKVLAGRMSGDEEKVAEGKKLMHKEG